MTTTNYSLRDKKDSELMEMVKSGKIILKKQEKYESGFYCGTWYQFFTTAHEHIKTTYVPSGFVI